MLLMLLCSITALPNEVIKVLNQFSLSFRGRLGVRNIYSLAVKEWQRIAGKIDEANIVTLYYNFLLLI